MTNLSKVVVYSAEQLLGLMTSELSLADEASDNDYRPKPNHYYVAFSGGVDSTVLLLSLIHI